MKKTFCLCGVIAALLALALTLSGCTAVFDRIFASGGDYKRASVSEDVGFLLSVPRTWITAESVVADGAGGFTYLVTATLSNSGSDNANVSAVSLPTDKSPEDFFNVLYEQQKGQFASVGAATGSNYHLDGSKGRQYEYNVTKKAGETTEVYRLMQLLVPKDGRMLVFTYTARYAPDDADSAEKDASFYSVNWRSVSTVLSELTFAPFRAPDVIPGEGMVPISDGKTQKFRVSVPAGWVMGVSSVSDYCKAVSPDGTLTVSAMAFLPQLAGDISIAAYWEEAALPELRGMFGGSFTVSEQGVTADFAGTKGARYAFRGDAGGATYYFLQYYLLVGNSLTPNLYLLSFTSTSPIDPENETVAAITASYGF